MVKEEDLDEAPPRDCCSSQAPIEVTRKLSHKNKIRSDEATLGLVSPTVNGPVLGWPEVLPRSHWVCGVCILLVALSSEVVFIKAQQRWWATCGYVLGPCTEVVELWTWDSCACRRLTGSRRRLIQ